MLTGKLVRVRHVRNKLVPQYVPTDSAEWRDVAERLLSLFRSLDGVTRDEMEEEIREVVGDNPTQLIHQGLAKLLEDRCDFEIQSDAPPDALREKVFLAAAAQRTANAKAGTQGFDRVTILNEAATELGVAVEEIDRNLFADLKGEQRLTRFRDLTVERLLHRYNEALAQAVLLRATRVSILINGETPQRYRQIFRAIKFHRLICEISSSSPNSYLLNLDGPMSLFSSTQKYGLQLSYFLPTLLQCKQFELTAHVRWGAKRVEKVFTLNQSQGLRSHLPDYGDYRPPELQAFAESFRKAIDDWELIDETAILPVGTHFWTPDFQLLHKETGRVVYLELFGFWRRADVQTHLERLRKHATTPFVLAVSEQLNTDENEGETPEEIYRFKRTPLPSEVARLAIERLDK
jgi:predicted nuclease of restriction endonuclease-like RecB superfamily